MNSQLEPVYPVIRSLNPGDLERVFEIELAAYPFPWSQGIFADCLRVGYDCSGLQIDTTLIGYAIQSQAAGESHLLNLCIDPSSQGLGYGSLLLDHAVTVARLRGCHRMFLEVRPSNPVGLGLYERRGFTELGRRKAYYRAADGREDAIVMSLNL